MDMPLGRYFVCMGSLLLALLFAAEWYLPKLAIEPAHADVDRRIIRVHSQQKWPEAVVLDTSLPAIAPSTATAALAPAEEKSPRQAFAQMLPSPPIQHARAVAPKAAAAKPAVERRRVRVARAAPRQLASYDSFGFRSNWPTGW